MADTITAYHSIQNVRFSASNLWVDNLSDINISVALHLTVGKKTSMKIELKPADAIVTEVNDGYKIIVTDTADDNTEKKGTIPYTELKEGTNTIRITITDEVPPDGQTGKSIYTHTVVVENRDSFKIKRAYDFPDEYLISGSGIIDINNNYIVTTESGVRKSLVIPRKAIEMDGRAKIRSVVVNADKDNTGTCEKDVTVNVQEDMGDCYMQTIPFTDILTFQKIDKVQAINATDAK